LTLAVATSLLPSDRPLEKGQFVGTLRRLLGFVRAYRRALWLSIVLALGASAFELAVPWLTGDVIDEAIRPRDTSRLKVLIALMLAAAVLRFVLMTIRRLVSGTMAVSIEYDLRNQTYAHLQRLSFSFYDRNQTGQLMSRATADVGMVRIFLSYGLLFFTQYLLTIVGVLIVLFLTNPLLSLVAVAIAPPIVYIAIRYSRVSHPILTEAQQTLADVTTQAEETVVGVRVVKAFGQEERETRRFREKSERIFDVNVRANALRARYVPLLAFVPALAVAGVLGLGGWMVVDGRATLGEFVRFNLLLGMLVMPLRMLGMWVGQAQRAVASGVRVLELLDLEPELADPPDPKPLPADGGGAIRFEGVRFGYEEDRPIVCDVDLDIPAGSTVALIGPTGCGKTTLTTLVPRFYDVTAGRVLVDGIDVRELSLTELRRSIGVVTEDTFLFSASVRENIAFGAPWATDDDVRQAADRAQATEFIESLPDGYATQIGERGLTLSGGQRQRIAIARALLVNPRILILDDATAAVDATTEAKIKRALQELMRDRTTIIIAHRLSTISLAERVVVMDRGRIVADGSHEALAETSELYSRIRTHGLLDRTFVDLDGDRYVPPKEGEPVAGTRDRGSRLG
jgi:ATP-binding cassette subfamily B protein